MIRCTSCNAIVYKQKDVDETHKLQCLSTTGCWCDTQTAMFINKRMRRTSCNAIVYQQKDDETHNLQCLMSVCWHPTSAFHLFVLNCLPLSDLCSCGLTTMMQSLIQLTFWKQVRSSEAFIAFVTSIAVATLSIVC